MARLRRDAMTTRAVLTPLAAIAIALALSTALSSGGRAGEAPAAPGEVAPGIVDAAAARRLVAEGVKVIDVRTAAEYAAGHIPGALNVPYDEVERRLEEIGPASTRVLLYCRSGRRSGIAAQTLREHGYTHLYDLKAYDLWVRSEQPAGR